MGGRVDVAVVLGLLQADGFEKVRSSSSHHIYSKGPGTPHVTVPWSNGGDFLPVGTAKSVAKKAGPHIEDALSAVMQGGKKALKSHIKALKKGAQP